MFLNTLLFLAALLAGAIASVSGFGIGSILTPIFAARIDTKLAVAAVAIPHFLATVTRFVMMRHSIDRRTMISFGSMSAAGGLAGALLHNAISAPALTLIFGVLLVFAGTTGLTGIAQRMRFRGAVAYISGALSGLFGGLVGNQGGIRSAGLLAFDLEKQAFVATATATGVIVDLVRMPVYLSTEWEALLGNWVLILTASVGALVGTFLGAGYLKRVSEPMFKRVVSGLILALGVYMLLFSVRP